MWSNIDDALKELRHNCKELTQIIYQKEKQIQFLETKALNLSMFYVASQLCIFLISNAKECRKSREPFFLSLSVAAAFALNFAPTMLKYVRTKYEQDRNYIDRQENFYQVAMLQKHGLRSSETDYETRPDMFAVYQRYAHLTLTVAALLAITALVLHACRSSLCAAPI